MSAAVYAGDAVYLGGAVRRWCYESIQMSLSGFDANGCSCKRFQTSPNRYFKATSIALDGDYTLVQTASDATYCNYSMVDNTFTGVTAEVYADSACTGSIVETATATSLTLAARMVKSTRLWEVIFTGSQLLLDGSVLTQLAISSNGLFNAKALGETYTHSVACTTPGVILTGPGTSAILSVQH